MEAPTSRIIITGPESSGKSTLATALGQAKSWPVVAEYAVEYLSEFGPFYDYGDIVRIAAGQQAREEEMLRYSNSPVICDTSMLVLHIWSKVRFRKTDPGILQWLDERKGELFLLCQPDIDWEPGPFRENPDDRDWLFGQYEQWLRNNRCNFCIISGTHDNRLQTAISFIEEAMRSN